ncbi:hypothetical protein GCM10023335_23790 [Streptomyces siamensis]|uniref:Uncharacterized protein n=1 Tax=Streptomyces siamensis TaxID=1274986 RepID=A0ABP9IQI5_9ACTN
MKGECGVTPGARSAHRVYAVVRRCLVSLAADGSNTDRKWQGERVPPTIRIGAGPAHPGMFRHGVHDGRCAGILRNSRPTAFGVSFHGESWRWIAFVEAVRM